VTNMKAFLEEWTRQTLPLQRTAWTKFYEKYPPDWEGALAVSNTIDFGAKDREIRRLLDAKLEEVAQATNAAANILGGPVTLAGTEVKESAGRVSVIFTWRLEERP